MPQADGTVLIDTEINTDGMEAGSEDVEAAARRMASSVSDLGAKAQNAISKQADNLIKVNKQYAAQKKTVDDLRAKVESYANVKIPTQEYTDIQNQISQATRQMNRLIAAQEKYISMGGKTNSKAFKNRQYDIDQLSNTINYAKTELKELEATGKAFTFGSSTKEAAADMKRLESAERRLSELNNRLGTSYSSMKNNIEEYRKSVLSADKGTKRLNKSIRNTEKSTKGARMGIGRMLATSILFSMVFRAISLVMSGIKEGFDNLAQYSGETNNSISMLWSSLERLKNSFATAFSPILTVVAPILSRFIDMLATATNYVGAFFSALTGKSTYTRAIKTQKDYAASLSDTASGASDAAKATDEAAEAAEGYLSPLDEINKMEKKDSSLGDSSGGGGASAGTSPSAMFETVPIESKIQEFADKVKKILTEMFQPLKDAWTIYGPSIKQTLGLILQDFINFGSKIGAATVDWFKNLDWKPLLSSVDQLLIKLEPLISLILDGLAWAYENVLLPFGKWTIEKGLPALLTLLGNAFDFIRVVLERLQPLFQWLWDHILKDFGVMVGNVVVEILNAFSGLLTFLTGVFSGDWQKAFSGLQQIISSFQNIIDYVFGFITNNILYPFDNFLQGIFATDWTEAFGLFGNILNAFFATAKNIWNGIKETFLGFIEFVKGVFSGDWKRALNGLAQIFKGIFDKLVGFAKSPINLIIGFLNGLISGVVGAVNTVIGALNGLHIDVPDVIADMTGIHSFGFDIPKFDAPRIPYLASGAVIPPNREFMAVLGDQKSGTNIEAPENLIRKLLREELAKQQTGSKTYAFTAQLNRRTLFEEFIKEAELQQMRTGKNPFELA